MSLMRTETWAEGEFDAFMRSRAETPFAWGSNDCCLFPADAIQAFTGTDIAADFRGKYSNEAEAFALVKTVAGGTTVADAAAYCAEKYGLVEWKFPLQAQRGDLVVIQNGDTLISGIVHLNGRHVVTVGEKGLFRVSITNIKRAWKV